LDKETISFFKTLDVFYQLLLGRFWIKSIEAGALITVIASPIDGLAN
jgi:hypothetical protein